MDTVVFMTKRFDDQRNMLASIWLSGLLSADTFISTEFVGFSNIRAKQTVFAVWFSGLSC